MSNYQLIGDLIVPLLEQNLKPNIPQGQAILVEFLEILNFCSVKDNSDIFVFLPWISRLILHGDRIDSTLQAYLLKTLSNTLLMWQSQEIFGFRNDTSGEIVNRLVEIASTLPLSFGALFAWRVISFLPVDLQMDLLVISRVDERLQHVVNAYQSYLSNIEQLKLQESVDTPLISSVEVFVTPEFAHLYASEIVMAVLRTVILNWHVISGQSTPDYRDIGTSMIMVILNSFLNLSQQALDEKSKPFSSALLLMDTLFYNYLAVPLNGKRMVPLCFLDANTSYNHLYDSLLVRAMPRLVAAMQTIMATLVNGWARVGHASTKDINAVSSLPKIFLTESLWFISGYSNKDDMSTEDYLSALEMWCLRGTLVCLLAGFSAEDEKKFGHVREIRQNTLVLLGHVITVLSSNNHGTNSMMECALLCRSVTCCYLLHVVASSSLLSSYKEGFSPLEFTSPLVCLSTISDVLKKYFEKPKDESGNLFKIFVEYVFATLSKFLALYTDSNLAITPSQQSNDNISNLNYSSMPDIFQDASNAVVHLLANISQNDEMNHAAENVQRFVGDGSFFLSIVNPKVSWFNNTEYNILFESIIPQITSNPSCKKELKVLIGPYGREVKKKQGNLKFALCACIPKSAILDVKDLKISLDGLFMDWQHLLLEKQAKKDYGRYLTTNTDNERKLGNPPLHVNSSMLRNIFVITAAIVRTSFDWKSSSFVNSFFSNAIMNSIIYSILDNTLTANVKRTENRKFLSYEQLGVIAWNLCISYLSFNPLLPYSEFTEGRKEQQCFPFANVLNNFFSKNQSVSTANKTDCFFWIDNVSLFMDTLWTVILHVTDNLSVRICLLSGMSWLLCTCAWIFFSISNRNKSAVQPENIPVNFQILINRLRADLCDFEQKQFYQSQNDFPLVFSISITLSYLIRSLKLFFQNNSLSVSSNSVDFPDWIIPCENSVTALVSGILSLENVSEEVNKEVLQNLSNSPSVAALKYVTNCRMVTAYASLALKGMQAQSAKSHDDNSQHEWLADPFLCTLTLSHWKHCILLNELQRSVVWSETTRNDWKNEIVSSVSFAPLMITTKQHSRYTADKIILSLQVDIHNVSDSVIENVRVELRARTIGNISPSVMTDHSLNAGKISEQNASFLFFTREAGFIQNLNPSAVLLGNIFAQMQESCLFSLEINSFLPIEMKIFLSYDSMSMQPDEEGDKDSEFYVETPRILGQKDDPMSYSSLKSVFESEYDDTKKHFPNLVQPCFSVAVPLSMFVRPFFGFGMWHDVGNFYEEAILQNLQWINGGLNERRNIWIDSQMLEKWNPSCMHLLVDGSCLRILIGQLFFEKDVLMLIIYRTLDKHVSMSGIYGDRMYSNDNLSLMEVCASTKCIADLFALSAEYWIYSQ